MTVTNEDPILQIKDVHCKFGNFEALKGINAQLEKNEVVVVCGPSGSGKSTLIRTLNRLESISAGQILFEGRDIYEKGMSVETLRTKIGMVFQSFNLFPHLSARDNVALGLIRVLHRPKKEAEQTASELLASVGLGDELHKKPMELSGGQQQRVSICRAVALEPTVMLFDEPTSALDPEMVGEVLSLMKTLAGRGMTMLCVTHEMGFAKEVADSIWFMADGQMVDRAPVSDFFSGDISDRAKSFLKAIH